MKQAELECGCVQTGHSLPVLVVEDDVGLNRLIQKTLQKAGFLTESALNGADAVAKASLDANLLLLLDYSLPDMTAQELVETLRARGCQAPFIVMTGYGDERIAVEMMKLNASDYLVKDAQLIQRLPAVIGDVLRKILLERRLEETRNALLRSEERYRHFVEVSSEGVWRCDIEPPVSLAMGERKQAEAILRQARLAECNNAYLRQFGHESTKQALGTPLYDLLTGTHQAKLSLALEVLRSGHRASSLETMDRLRDGRTLWTLNNIVGIEHEGSLVCIWGTTRDITDRKHTEEALHTALKEAEDLYNNAPCGYHSLDGNGAFLRINDTELKWIGRSREEVVGRMNFADLLTPDSRKTFLENFPSFKERGWIKALEFEVVRKDGTIFFVLMNATALRDETGAFLMTRATMFDITERRQVDEERRRLASAIEHATDAVIITDAEGITRYVNPATEQMFGHPRGQALGAHIAKIVNGRGGQISENLQEAAASGNAWSGRVNVTDINDRSLAVEVTASPIRNENGRTEELVTILRDVTKESALEAQMRQTQKLEAIGTLAGGIAHDFNNILSAIIGYTQMALTAIPPDSPPVQDLEQVLVASNRAADLVRQILTFGRRQESQQPLPLRLDILAKEALALLRASIPTTVEIRSNIAAHCDCVMGEPSQLHQIIVNLCTNAYHAMEQDGGLLAFSIEPVKVDEEQAAAVPGLRPGAYVQMTVSDTGCGMDQATLDRAFDPFFTTKPQGKGTGLGLSIAHGIVKSHDGAIDIQSAPGKGTTVRVWLPTVKMTVQEDGVCAEAPLAGHGERILFVDDEAALVKLGKRVLTNLGYAAIALNDANEAFELFRSDPAAFDLMVTDQTMPHCTGLQLATRVHAIRPNLPILLLSGLNLSINEEDAAAAGVTEVLGKPVVGYTLGKSISRALMAARKAELRAAPDGDKPGF